MLFIHSFAHSLSYPVTRRSLTQSVIQSICELVTYFVSRFGYCFYESINSLFFCLCRFWVGVCVSMLSLRMGMAKTRWWRWGWRRWWGWRWNNINLQNHIILICHPRICEKKTVVVLNLLIGFSVWEQQKPGERKIHLQFRWVDFCLCYNSLNIRFSKDNNQWFDVFRFCGAQNKL